MLSKISVALVKALILPVVLSDDSFVVLTYSILKTIKISEEKRKLYVILCIYPHILFLAPLVSSYISSILSLF